MGSLERLCVHLGCPEGGCVCVCVLPPWGVMEEMFVVFVLFHFVFNVF